MLARALLLCAVLPLLALVGAPAASSTDLGEGNEAVAKAFDAWTETGPRLETSEAERRVLITGFGLFAGVEFNISGVVVASMADAGFWPPSVGLDALETPPADAVASGRLRPGDSGARAWQRTLEIDGVAYEVGFLLLDVAWDLAAAITLYEARHFEPHLIVMTGRGGKDAIFEAGALDRAVRYPGFRSDGEPDPANTPISPHVLDPETPGLEETVGMSWDAARLAAAARPIVDALERGFRVVAAEKARPENTYICNNIACAVLHALERGAIRLAGGRVTLEDVRLKDTAAGFFHYPAAATNEPAEVLGWARMLATVVTAHFHPDADGAGRVATNGESEAAPAHPERPAGEDEEPAPRGPDTEPGR